jgi:hypothetical protein
MHCRPLQATFRNRIRSIQAIQCSGHHQLRSKSTEASKHVAHVTPGFIFDIDGVLKVGKKVLPQGQEVGDSVSEKLFANIVC